MRWTANGGFMKKCKWLRIFDGHFNISCVNETGERANGMFKPCDNYSDSKWNFKYCPYCGREIEVEKAEEDN
jgi:hypothetical protein